MSILHESEKQILSSIMGVAKTYQKYEENFNDVKLEQIRTDVIQKVSDWGKDMLQEFDSLETIIKEMINREIINES